MNKNTYELPDKNTELDDYSKNQKDLFWDESKSV